MIYISGRWIRPANYFWGQHEPKGQHRPKFNNYAGISKILNFHASDFKFEEDLHISLLNSTSIYFWGQHRPKVNKGRISKIVNLYLIDLKFSEELPIWTLNSTTNYFWGEICFMDFASIVLCTTSSSCLFVCLFIAYRSQF